MLEIERKFLVSSTSFKEEAFAVKNIKQGFLNHDPQRTVRVRLKDNKGFIAVKGKNNLSGTTRFEWEKEITAEEAENLLTLCEKGIIEKMRYEVKAGDHIFEVDEFTGENEGLVLAEIELSEENEAFQRPPWLGVEVTGDLRYYNSQLSKNPFKTWAL